MSNGFGMILPQPVTAFIGGQQARQGLEAERMRQQAMQEEMARSNKLRELGGAAFAAPAGPERQAALGQVAQVDPQQAINLQQQFAQLDETQKAQLRSQAREKLEPIAREIAYVSSLPEGQRQQAYDNALQRLAAQGADVSQFQGMPAEQGLMRARSQISEVSELLGIGGAAQPAGVREFEAMTQGLSPEEVEQARRVQLGLQARPTSAGFGFRTVLGQDGREYLVQTDPRTGGVTQTQFDAPAGQQPSSDAVIAEMNRRVRAGAPTQEVESWAQSQLQGVPAQPIASPTIEEQAAMRARGAASGKIEAASPERQREATQSLNRAEDQLNTMDRLANQLAERANFFTTGVVGAVGSFVPGTPQHDMARDIDTLKAVIGFRELQAMRDASPTGGALGQVTEFENRLLQATIANLEQSQSPAQFRRNLRLVQQQAKQSWDRVREAYQEDFGARQPSELTPAAQGWSIQRVD